MKNKYIYGEKKKKKKNSWHLANAISESMLYIFMMCHCKCAE